MFLSDITSMHTYAVAHIRTRTYNGCYKHKLTLAQTCAYRHSNTKHTHTLTETLLSTYLGPTKVLAVVRLADALMECLYRIRIVVAHVDGDATEQLVDVLVRVTDG